MATTVTLKNRIIKKIERKWVLQLVSCCSAQLRAILVGAAYLLVILKLTSLAGKILGIKILLVCKQAEKNSWKILTQSLVVAIYTTMACAYSAQETIFMLHNE